MSHRIAEVVKSGSTAGYVVVVDGKVLLVGRCGNSVETGGTYEDTCRHLVRKGCAVHVTAMDLEDIRVALQNEEEAA